MIGMVHQLAAVSKQAGGITFIDSHRKILTDYDKSEVEIEETNYNVPENIAEYITGVSERQDHDRRNHTSEQARQNNHRSGNGREKKMT